MKIFQITPQLRWKIVRIKPDTFLEEKRKVLQQAWKEIKTGEVDWRDVPTS